MLNGSFRTEITQPYIQKIKTTQNKKFDKADFYNFFLNISENFDINNFKGSLRTQRLNLEADIEALRLYTTAFWQKINT